MVGKTISHYKILEKLGEGGMGIVYKAFDTKLERDVAIKILRPEAIGDPAARERFIREARAASALNHPGVTTIYEINEWHGQDFICMEYVAGETVKEKILKGQIPIEEVLDIALQVAEAIKEAHDHHLIHRDIKSENIMITTKGQVKVMDFGLAKISGTATNTQVGTTMGTIAYMSPEQTRGENVDHRTDIWSFGVVLYEMLTGQLPFKGDFEQAVIYSILNEEPPSIEKFRPEVPNAFKQILNKTLQKNQTSRYQHVDEMVNDLKQFAQASPTTRISLFSQLSFPAYAKTRLIPAAIVLAILIGIVVGFFAFQPLFLNAPIDSEPQSVAVLPFENLTGDRTYNLWQKSIANLLIARLEQSKHLRVTTWEHLGDLLKQIGKGNLAIDDLDKETGFELCRLDSVTAVVTGSYSKIGNMFAIEVKILDVTSKEILWSKTSTGEGENSIFTQIDDLAATITKGFSLSQRKIKKPVKNQPLNSPGNTESFYKHKTDSSANTVVFSNIVTNGDFSNGDTGWNVFLISPARAKGSVINGEYFVSITEGGPKIECVKLSQFGLILEKGKKYIVSFMAYATDLKQIGITLNKYHYQEFKIDIRKRKYKFEFTMKKPTDDNVILYFNLGLSNADVYLDNIDIREKQITGKLENGDFSDGDKYWTTISFPETSVYPLFQNGKFLMSIAQGGSQCYHVQLAQTDLFLKNGKKYTITFDASAEGARKIWIYLGQGHEPWWIFHAPQCFNLNTSWQTYQYSFNMLNPSDPESRLYFDLGLSEYDVRLDNIVLTEENDESALDAQAAKSTLPSAYRLFQNYLNPFNHQTIITYHLPQYSEVLLTIYNAYGQPVRHLTHVRFVAGVYYARWDGRDETGQEVASGIYFYRFEAKPVAIGQSPFVEMKKMIFIK